MELVAYLIAVISLVFVMYYFGDRVISWLSWLSVPIFDITKIKDYWGIDPEPERPSVSDSESTKDEKERKCDPDEESCYSSED